MEKAIREFIKDKAIKGKYFDSHAVIDYILQQYPDTYIQNVGNYKEVRGYHSWIAQKITHLEKEGLVERIKDSEGKPVEIISKTIKDDFTPCALWKKL